MSGPGTSSAKTAARPKLDIDRTRERLIALGCGHAAEQLGDVLGGAVAQEIAPQAFLDRLLEAELAGREERRVRTALKLSNLPTGQTLESFDFACPARDRALAHRDAGNRRLGPRRGDGSAAGPDRRRQDALWPSASA